MRDITLKEFMEKIQSENKKIVCFGTGLMLEDAMSNKDILERIVYLVDNNREKQGRNLLVLGREYSVYSPEEIVERLDEQTVILITSGYYKEILNQLETMNGIDNTEIYSYPEIRVNLKKGSEEFFEKRILDECLKEYEELLVQFGIDKDKKNRLIEEKKKYILGSSVSERPVVLPRIMIMPTTKCNLRCKGCSSLLPLFDKPCDVEIDKIITDLKRFFAAIDQCIRITIGGEPFLYPRLKEVLEYLIDEQKVLGIIMITNSTILPKTEIIELMKNKKVMVEVSDYGHLEKMSRLITLLEKNDVYFKVLTEQKWTDMGGVQYRNRTQEELRFSYLNCEQSRIIKGVHDGKFFTCARCARMLALGVFKSERDYFDLSDDSEYIRGRIKEMYSYDYADACNYCDLGSLPTKVIDAGVQLNGSIEKSAYTIVNREEYERLKRESVLRGRQ